MIIPFYCSIYLGLLIKSYFNNIFIYLIKGIKILNINKNKFIKLITFTEYYSPYFFFNISLEIKYRIKVNMLFSKQENINLSFVNKSGPSPSPFSSPSSSSSPSAYNESNNNYKKPKRNNNKILLKFLLFLLLFLFFIICIYILSFFMDLSFLQLELNYFIDKLI